MMLCCRTYHQYRLHGSDLLLITEFTHSIGSRILPVLPQHIPAFFTPTLYTYSVPHSRILPTPTKYGYYYIRVKAYRVFLSAAHKRNLHVTADDTYRFDVKYSLCNLSIVAQSVDRNNVKVKVCAIDRLRISTKCAQEKYNIRYYRSRYNCI